MEGKEEKPGAPPVPKTKNWAIKPGAGKPQQKPAPTTSVSPPQESPRKSWGTIPSVSAVKTEPGSDRLRGLSNGQPPDLSSPLRTLGGFQKPKFEPNIARGKASESTLDKKFPTPLPNFFKEDKPTIATPKRGPFGQNARPFDQKRPMGTGNLKPKIPPTTPSVTTNNTKPKISVARPASKPVPKKEDKPVIHHGLDPMNVTHPVVLPFRDEEILGAEMPVPELLANAEDVGDQIFFMQIPSMLPKKPQEKPSGKDEKPGTKSEKGKESEASKEATQPPTDIDFEYDQFTSTLQDLGTGYVGKLLVYKSGKMKMKIGDLVFDLMEGTKCSFLQEAAVIDHEKGQFYVMGEVSHRLICMPDMEDILSSTFPNIFNHDDNT